MADRLLTTEDLMKIFSVSRQAIFDWRANGMPFIRLGRLIRFEEEKVFEWFKEKNENK